MNLGIITLQGNDGYPVVVNLRYVAFATPAMMQGQNGAAKQVAVGLCAIKMATGDLLVVKSTMEELYRRLKGGLTIVKEGEWDLK